MMETELKEGDFCFGKGLGREVHRIEMIVGALALLARGDGGIRWEAVSRLQKLPPESPKTEE